MVRIGLAGGRRRGSLAAATNRDLRPKEAMPDRADHQNAAEAPRRPAPGPSKLLPPPDPRLEDGPLEDLRIGPLADMRTGSLELLAAWG